ncbi:hypothetical protein N7457_007311 [Penicillium paradoxum]|uniref:uncharacterized protein n=1 Tax=Penicillium paradoxum TaxID=176176 RepID=UPI00254744B6|nr:uncharacterized protein N7457_007311 [Penicillium paradoxum]KAJ5779591.1 hypothetical protein N7457_007311 [Penicillium paradoxum]
MYSVHPSCVPSYIMPKRKRPGGSPSPPPRSSHRPRQPRQIFPSRGTFCSVPSFAQTEVEKADDGNNLIARARERLGRYDSANESQQLQTCFEGLLDWLPPGGRDSTRTIFSMRKLVKCP